MLWAEPAKTGKTGWGSDSIRGIYTFGADILGTFLATNRLKLLCRGRRVVKDGYEYFPKEKWVGIVSCPRYLDYNNRAAVMHIHETGKHSFTVGVTLHD